MVFLYLVWSLEDLRLFWANGLLPFSLECGAWQSGFSILYLVINIAECKFKVYGYLEMRMNVIFIFLNQIIKQIYTGTFYAKWDIFCHGGIWVIKNYPERFFLNTTWNVGYLSLKFCSDDMLCIASNYVFMWENKSKSLGSFRRDLVFIR